MTSVQALIDRIAEDPDLLTRLQSDVHGTAAAEGIEIDDAELRQALEIGAGDDIGEALQSRLSHSSGSSQDCGGPNFGGCISA